MSSGVDAGAVILPVVALPVGTAYGAGWLAWQGGKLLVEANREANRQIAEKKRQLEQEALHRRRAALAAHSQLVEMCNGLLSQLGQVSLADFAEMERLRAEVREISREEIPDDTGRLESLTALGLAKLDRIAAKQQTLFSRQLEEENAGLYRGHCLADLMLDMKVALSAMDIRNTRGNDVRAADPVVLEREKLNEKLADVTRRVTESLECVAELASQYGLSSANNAWLHSCFDGVDQKVAMLYRPSTANAELKKGIRRLEELLDQYDTLMPTIESEEKKFAALYGVYVDASRALGEKIRKRKAFPNTAALEQRLEELKSRGEQARKCADIYSALGPMAYTCYAWDQELQALGYSVHSRKEIAELAGYKPQHARLEEGMLPFYKWSDGDLTQLYSMASQCSLQVIVHDDGTVSMQTMSEADDSTARKVQAAHCAQLAALHENLRKNWFILYDYQETVSPDQVVSAAEWFGSEDSSWKPAEKEQITDRRTEEKKDTLARQK